MFTANRPFLSGTVIQPPFNQYHSCIATRSLLFCLQIIQQIKSAVTEATAPKTVSLDCCDTTHPMTGMKETGVFAERRNCHRFYYVVSHHYYNPNSYYLSNNLLLTGDENSIYLIRTLSEEFIASGKWHSVSFSSLSYLLIFDSITCKKRKGMLPAYIKNPDRPDSVRATKINNYLMSVQSLKFVFLKKTVEIHYAHLFVDGIDHKTVAAVFGIKDALLSDL